MSAATFSSDTIRLGSRGSPLALWQTRWVAQALLQQHPGLRTEVVVIRTSGDRNRRDPLSQLGGKGLFVKEIEAALAHRQIDLAVHSMKDMPTELPPGLHFGAIPKRAEVRDAFVGREGRQLAGPRRRGALAREACAARRNCWSATRACNCATFAAMWTRGCASCTQARPMA